MIKPKIKGATFSQKGLQGILYEHEKNTLFICDSGNNKIIELEPNSGVS